MFEDLQNDPNSKVDDIFADSDRVEEPKPRVAPSNIDRGPAPQAPATLPDFDEDDSSGRSGKIIKKFFLVIVILLVIFILAYILYSKVLLPRTVNQGSGLDNNIPLIDNEVNIPSNVVDVDTDEDALDSLVPVIADEEDSLIATSSEENILEEEEVEEVIADSDNDGLSDDDEIYVYGTNPYIIDTDGDGLSDFDEIMIFGTDPLNPDTDNDGFLDGGEVLAGYSPLSAEPKKLDLDSILDQELFQEKYPELWTKITQ
ncbi:MAG: hypothetical protein ACOXZ1_00470 [Patescibacteria group bacterium]|jgi:hypothetical protein